MLRRENKALLADAPVELLAVDNESVLAYHRSEDILVLINFSDLPVQFSLSEITGAYRDVFSHQQLFFSKDHTLHLSPRGYLLLAKA